MNRAKLTQLRILITFLYLACIEEEITQKFHDFTVRYICRLKYSNQANVGIFFEQEEEKFNLAKIVHNVTVGLLKEALTFFLFLLLNFFNLAQS